MYCVGSDPGSPGSNAVTWLQVVAINVTVNALLVVLLSYMTITTVKILTTVQFQVPRQFTKPRSFVPGRGRDRADFVPG